MIAWAAVLTLALAAGEGHEANAGNLPVCSNRVVAEVTRRIGCTLGDARCWSKKRGYCGDHVEVQLAAAGKGTRPALVEVKPEEVQPGDVAAFTSRAHYALVTAVVRDKRGRPVAVSLTEFNFGTCWVDRNLLVTDQFMRLGRRTGVLLTEVDGGFLRPGPGVPAR